MKALILNGEVVDLNATEFEVAETMTWVDCDDTVKRGYSYADGTFTAPVDTRTAEDKLASLRTIRNIKLTECDWTQGNDSPLSDADKTAWSTYRQSLRDITDTYNSLDTVVWPTKPE